MNPSVTERPQDATAEITADLTYTIDTGIKPVNETFGPGNIRRRTTGATQQRPVRIRDGRPLAGQFDFERNGFVFVEHATGRSVQQVRAIPPRVAEWPQCRSTRPALAETANVGRCCFQTLAGGTCCTAPQPSGAEG